MNFVRLHFQGERHGGVNGRWPSLLDCESDLEIPQLVQVSIQGESFARFLLQVGICFIRQCSLVLCKIGPILPRFLSPSLEFYYVQFFATRGLESLPQSLQRSPVIVLGRIGETLECGVCTPRQSDSHPKQLSLLVPSIYSCDVFEVIIPVGVAPISAGVTMGRGILRVDALLAPRDLGASVSSSDIVQQRSVRDEVLSRSNPADFATVIRCRFRPLY